MFGIYAITDRVDLMRLARQAQDRGCWATAQRLLDELARRGPMEQAA